MKILVTGGASGLGAEIVNLLSTDIRNFVFFTYNHSTGGAKAITDERKNTEAIKCDFTDVESVERLLVQIESSDIDVLVNNAYSSFEKDHFHKIPSDAFLKGFQNNVIPTLRITQTCISGFRKKKFGKIINIISSSVIGNPPIGWSEYVANKSYLLSMSKSWSTENIKFNITSNCISPSFMITHMTSDTDERIVEQIKNEHPLKELLTPKSVAETVAFFLGSSQHINGTNIVINAGL